MSSTYPSIDIPLSSEKQIYFASDFHLGAPDPRSSKQREQLLIQWMEEIRPQTQALFLVGDLFDFWFEYRHVVPKGAVRFLSAIAAFTDAGIPVYVFTGNHDIWMFGYLEEELGVQVFRHPVIVRSAGKTFFVGHGDGLGPDDTKFKLMKKVFTFPLFQWMFKWLHPDIGITIAQKWSAHSRTDPATERFMGKDRERLYQYTLRKSQEVAADYFVFGHRHLPVSMDVEGRATYINLGDWLYNYTFLQFDGEQAVLQKFLK